MEDDTMFTTSLERLNIRWVSLTATILSSSRYGAEYDRVKILHEIGLEIPLQQDETFYIPPQGKPLDTRTAFPDGNITNFAGQRFKDLNDELAKYAEALKNGDRDKMNELHQLFLQTTILSPVLYKAGTQVLTFEYELALYPNDNNTFELALWAPMPTFNVVPGGQVTTTIQLPSTNNNAFRANLLEAKGFIADAQGNLGGEISPALHQEVGLRRIISWNWNNDPYFKVSYQYQ